jgi:hypothetical protein
MERGLIGRCFVQTNMSLLVKIFELSFRNGPKIDNASTQNKTIIKKKKDMKLV